MQEIYWAKNVFICDYSPLLISLLCGAQFLSLLVPTVKKPPLAVRLRQPVICALRGKTTCHKLTDQGGRESRYPKENVNEGKTVPIEKTVCFSQRKAAPISPTIRNPGSRHWDELLTMSRY